MKRMSVMGNNKLLRLFEHISKKRKTQLLLLLFLILAASILESLNVAMIFPLIKYLTSNPELGSVKFIDQFKDLFLINEENVREFIVATFCAIILMAGFVRLLLLYANNKISVGIGSELSEKMLTTTLYQPYSFHCATNSSKVANALINSSAEAVNAILMFVTLVSSVCMLLAILSTLLFIDTTLTLVMFSTFGLVYLVVVKCVRSEILKNGKVATNLSERVLKLLQESLGSVRDIIIDNSQDVYISTYRNANFYMRKAYADNIFLSSFPRIGIESIGIVIIAVVAFVLTDSERGKPESAIAILAAMVFGAQKMLPIMQQTFSSWSTIRGSNASMENVLLLLNQKTVRSRFDVARKIKFDSDIEFRNVQFAYDSTSTMVLDNISFRIPKGARLGVVGKTGSGKSTLIDLLMALLEPTSGQIFIDGKKLTVKDFVAWRARLSHVPQSIFLADSSVRNNIAFGVPDVQIDDARVVEVSKIAQLHNFISSLPENYETIVGERGVKLSGGQRQRIGIARALYKSSDLIILDEATSALDFETERSVIAGIQRLQPGITIVMVAHRINTLKDCTKFIEVKNGFISEIQNYEDLIAATTSSEF